MIRTVYVIHHSHTDIGFTHGQSRIIHWHGNFIRQAMNFATQRPDFAWTCETFFPVERFWQTATEHERNRFSRLCAGGQIGLTSYYLHFNELADAGLLRAIATRARKFADEQELPLSAAMLADINGVPLAHACALVESGTTFLMTCVHPHHGYPPLRKRQELFDWELGNGKTLRVLLADHYHTGNELGLAPGAELNYTAGFSDPPGHMDDALLDRRLPEYLRRLESSGWRHDFAVLAVSGLNTDNAPPSLAIADRIQRWNQLHGSEIRIEMSTPTWLAEITAGAAAKTPLPRYAGDWPDWWSDGSAGDPEAVALFRQAQRDRRWLAALPLASRPTADVMSQLDETLALFAEHTFGHSAAITAPWNLLAQQLRLRKLGFAAEAADTAELLVDRAAETMGGGSLAFDRPPAFRVINPHADTRRALVELEIEACEAQRWELDISPVCVVNSASGERVEHQSATSLRGIKLLVDLTLNGGARIDLRIERDIERQATPPTRAVNVIAVPDQMHDVAGDEGSVAGRTLETPFVQIEWNPADGITRWFDRTTARDLLDPAAGVAPFILRSSRLRASQDGVAQSRVRRELGRNRNGEQAKWSQSTFIGADHHVVGPLLASVELQYEIEGCEHVQLILHAWQSAPRVDVELRMHKVGTWDAENVYLALPFTAGERAVLWFDRGLPMRPGIDQLPGSLCDFFGVQDGIASCTADHGVGIAQLDSHLIQLGPLTYGVRQLAGDPVARANTPWAWLMTNYWETNFSPEVGGFYSFRFSVGWGASYADPNRALELNRHATESLKALRLGAPSTSTISPTYE